MKKMALLMLKSVPVIGALLCALNSTLAYFGIDLAWTGYLMRVLFLIAWFMLARFFGFCSFYYKLIGYIILAQTINSIDYLYGIPLSDKGMFILHCGLIGFMLLLFTYCHVRDTKRLKRHLTKAG